MAANAVENRRGVPGRKPYENKKLPDRFAGLNEKEKLQAICAHIQTTDREQRIRRNTVYYLMALYYQGYQNIDIQPGSATFDVYEREDFYVENQFRHHVDAVVNSLSKNEGDIVIRPASSQPKDITKARVAGPVLDMQKSTIGYDRVKDIKNLYKVLFGNAFTFVDYIRDAKHGTIVTAKYKYEEIPDETDPNADPYLSKVPDGFTKVNRGSEVCVVCSPLEISVRADTKGFENLPYIQWRTRQDNEKLNYMYPGLGLEGGTNAVDEDMAQQYLDVLGNLPGNLLGDSIAYNQSSYEVKKSEYVRTWLTPCMFAGDKSLEAKFPKGVHVATVNGRVVDYYEEDMFDRWTHEVLIPVPHSLLGDGLYDALLMQDQINEMNSLLIQHMRYSTVGHKIFDTQIIDPKDVVNDPKNGWIPGRASLDKTIAQAVFELRPTQLSGDVPQWLQTVKTSMQDMTSAYDSSVGKSIGANTPYSQSVFLTERAQSRWQGSLSYNRPQLVRFNQQLLKIAQNEWMEAKTASVIANTGSWSFQQFTQADLAGEVDITISNTDMAPKGRAEQVQALQMLQQMAQLLPMLPPKQKLRVEEILGLPPDSNPMSTQISRAYRQIDRIVNGDDISPLPFVDDPQIQIPVIQDFLADEQGEDLAMENPEVFAKVYTYMSALLMMMQGQQGFAQPGGAQPGAPNGPSAPGEKKPAGGQQGQPGGGPGSPDQPNAQSPAPNAPPVAPPSA